MVTCLSTVPKFSFDDVLLVPGFSTKESRSKGISLKTTLGRESFRIPIISSNMDTITDLEMAKKMARLGGLGVFHRGTDEDPSHMVTRIFEHWSKSIWGKPALSVGSITRPREKKRIDAILNRRGAGKLYQDEDIIICAEIAYGDHEILLRTIDYIRNHHGFDGMLIAGSVCTKSGVQRLKNAGADAVRVGIGPGSACETRIKTGCGYPQLSAIHECSEVDGIDIIADGGIRTPSDAVKAIAFGASAIMIGGMLKGTDCVPGWAGSGKQIVFRGMASNDAKVAAGIAAGYEEGISTVVISKELGSTEAVIKNISDGLLSAMSMNDAANLEEFREKAQYVFVTPSCVKENRAHSVYN